MDAGALSPARRVLPFEDEHLDVAWVALSHDDAPTLALGIARVGQTFDAAGFLGNAGVVVPWLCMRLGDMDYKHIRD
jgi:hypothetical protein